MGEKYNDGVEASTKKSQASFHLFKFYAQASQKTKYSENEPEIPCLSLNPIKDSISLMTSYRPPPHKLKSGYINKPWQVQLVGCSLPISKSQSISWTLYS